MNTSDKLKQMCAVPWHREMCRMSLSFLTKSQLCCGVGAAVAVDGDFVERTMDVCRSEYCEPATKHREPAMKHLKGVG